MTKQLVLQSPLVLGLRAARSKSSSVTSFRSIFISTTARMSMEEGNHYTFGPYKIDPKEVFYSTAFSYAMVNLRPVLPEKKFLLQTVEVLEYETFCVYEQQWRKELSGAQKLDRTIADKLREVKRFVDLTAPETSDLWLTAQKVGSRLESFHKATSITFSIQDGPQAGQTVPHVHIHILPRKCGDFERNDDIYDAIDDKEKELKQKLDLDKERKDRSLEEMIQEADEYRSLFL